MNKFKCLFFSGLMAVMPACMNGQQTSSEDSSKPRVIITCDPELDDLNSLIRFLLFRKTATTKKEFMQRNVS